MSFSSSLSGAVNSSASAASVFVWSSTSSVPSATGLGDPAAPSDGAWVADFLATARSSGGCEKISAA